MKAKSPNFFIAGAPKCGTTALHEYLKTHPSIFMPEIKEPYYFYSHKDKLPLATHTAEEYSRIYHDAQEEATLLGDSSVLYLMDYQSHIRIRDFCKESRIITMVRNPLDMAYALHGQYLLAGWEDISDFQTAWNKQELRNSNDKLPAQCPHSSVLQYRDVCMNGRHITKLLETFPKEQVMVVIFDDFLSDTLGIYKKVLEFLGAPYDGRTNFPPVNESRLWRHQGVATLLNSLKQPWAKIKKVLNIERTGIWNLSKDILAAKGKRRALSTEFKKELLSGFIDDISTIERITNRDLSKWKKEI
ncbi:MAG: sulfotransferase [Nitrospinota bacterium]|nr:sulfotransferase [Nitrospinota bacterium]